ncbi:F-box domain-containing protein [Mycena kentingensis (nom. inval.)]|nr:F-box domain-containing protein [Mycena kentingensis (nom. inval.)]
MSSTILLTPRPYAQYAGSFMLVALLPPPKQLPELPSELWSEILRYVGDLRASTRVCRTFKELAYPLVYARIKLSQPTSFAKFVQRLEIAEQHWSPIHRFPYSSPGRWCQSLDLSGMEFVGQAQALELDSHLVMVFPLVPFLARLSMNPAFVLSRRVMESLGRSIAAVSLRALEGISYTPSGSRYPEEPLVKLLRCCVNLEEVEVIGPGELAELPEATLPEPFTPLHLPRLRTLTILSDYASSLLLALIHSPLPALEKLTITPYDDVPNSLSTHFIETHGAPLRSLLLFTPKSWPTRLHASPHSLLRSSPAITHLSLERPLPNPLDLPLGHPLQILSVPRPDAEFYGFLDRFLLPRLPNLRAVRARDVRWLRKGMGVSAQSTGVQGDMMEWRRRLLRKGIRMLDVEWKEYEA